LGLGGAAGQESSLGVLSGEDHGSHISGDWERSAMLEVTGITVGGRLGLSVSYSRGQYEEATIERLSEAYQRRLEELIEELSAMSDERLTPVDLTFKELRVEEWLRLNSSGDIEDVYTLSPLQEGLYYQWLMSPQGSAYFEQMSYHVEGELNIGVMEKSYRWLVQRHAILRTSFSREWGDRPLQVVRREVESGFHYRDVSGEGGFSIEGFRAADRAKGFDLHRGSQMRLHVLRTGEGVYEFVWSHHHILMDGWCVSILIREFFQIYYSLLQGVTPQLEKVYPYAGYIEWLQGQDAAASLSYWRRYLSGYEGMSVVPKKDDRLLRAFAPASMTLRVNGELREAIRVLCGQLGVTESTFIQVAWGILLGRYNGTTDVVFGAVVSGRPAELKGVEEMIGMFINTIPVRIRMPATMPAAQLLKDVHRDYIDGTAHHHIQLAAVQAQSALKQGLFDHTLTFENFPVQSSMEHEINGRKHIKASLLTEVYDRNDYDFSIVIIPGEQLSFKFVYNEAAHEPSFIMQVWERLLRIMEKLTEDPSLPVGRLDHLSAEEKRASEDAYSGHMTNYTTGFNAAVSDEF